MENDGQLATRRNIKGADGVYFLFKMRATEGDVHAFTRRSRGKFNGEGKEWPCSESWERCEEFDADAAWRDMAGIPGASFEVKRTKEGRPVGIVARAEEGVEKALFGALLGVARSRGLSIAAPERGLLLGTPDEPEKRAGAWLTLRKGMLLDRLQRAGGLEFRLFAQTKQELCYIAFRFPVQAKGSAIDFVEFARAELWPDEKLECHVGWLSVVGPDGAYRLNVNWEDWGKHSQWIPDFSGPGVSVVLSHRASYLMALRAPREKSLVEVGLFHPAVVVCIPDPVDRFVSLRLANHRLTERVPREVVEALKEAKARNAAEKERAE
jgi:hypothetical protein